MTGLDEAHVIVSGRVQGVWFRGYTQRAASAAGVHGWVRNRPDGAVEALVEGEQSDVDHVEAALRRGPASSRVDEVRVEDAVPAYRATGFSIR